MRTPARIGQRLDVSAQAGARTGCSPGVRASVVMGLELIDLFCARFERTGRPVLSLLRPGKRPSGEEVEQILRHVIGRIRRNWPAVEIMVRGDSHFATPEVMNLLEEKYCSYIFGLSTNPRLTEIGRPWSEDVATNRTLKPRRCSVGSPCRSCHRSPARIHGQGPVSRSKW